MDENPEFLAMYIRGGRPLAVAAARAKAHNEEMDSLFLFSHDAGSHGADQIKAMDDAIKKERRGRSILSVIQNYSNSAYSNDSSVLSLMRFLVQQSVPLKYQGEFKYWDHEQPMMFFYNALVRASLFREDGERLRWTYSRSELISYLQENEKNLNVPVLVDAILKARNMIVEQHLINSGNVP